MKNKLIFAPLFALILAGCGKETIREVLVTTPPTEAPAVESNKYDQYLDSLYNGAAQARSWTESDLLELGSAVCEVFDAGGTFDGLIEVFIQNSNGAYDDEFYAAVTAGAVTFLCPEWAAYVEAQI